MHATVYLHPLRTIAMHWETKNGVPILVGYVESDAIDPSSAFPSDIRDRLCADASETTVVIHTNNIRFHSFPIEEGEEVSERLAFELQEFLHEADRVKDRVTLMPHTGMAYDTAWMSLTDVPSVICDHVASAFGKEVHITTDIECDVRAAQRGGPTVLAGVRGQWLWTAALSASLESPYHIERVHLHNEVDVATAIYDAVAELTATLVQQWNSITLIGDVVTPELISQVAGFALGSGQKVLRINAFHQVHASVDADIQQKVLKRAHLLSTLVGAILE